MGGRLAGRTEQHVFPDLPNGARQHPQGAIANEAAEACDHFIAARTACVVVALP